MALRLNITFKLVGYLLAVSLLPLAIFAWTSYEIARSTVVTQATDYSRQQLAGQRDYLELQIEQIESLAANIGGVQDILNALERADLGDASQADAYQRLSTQARVGYILNGYSNLKGLVSIDLYSAKGLHFHVGDTLSVADIDEKARRSYYDTALNSDRSVVWQGVADNLNIRSATSKVVLATKILRSYSEARRRTEPVGILMISYSIDYLYQHFSRVDFGTDAYLLVVDSAARLIYHPDRKVVGQTLSPAFLELIRSNEGSEAVRLGGEQVLLTHTQLPYTGWRLVGVIPQKTLLLPMQRLQNNAWLLTAFCLVIIAFVARMYTRSVVEPIKAISSGFRKIEENPQADLANLPNPRTNDEIAEMVAWFNTFLENLRGRRQSDELIWNQANFDILTGLPNRRLFRDRLEVETKKAARDDRLMALCFIDLDCFKEINDSLGHDIGDELLIQAARRIERCVRRTDTVGRFGGDEFTVILSALDESGNAGSVADKIILALAQPFLIGKETCHVSASIGISFCPSDSDDAEGVLKNADQAMYVAKDQGRNRYTFFSRAMQEHAQARQALRNELRGALAAKQFSLHFQPIFELSSGRLLKAEALIRWLHPGRGFVSPVEFIPIAEETGLINEIGEWVFDEAASWARRWANDLGYPVQISVNRSPVQFRDQTDYAAWSNRLRALGLPGSAIAVEITEGLLLNASPNIAAQLKQYREAGIQVSIDDFGTGYSSMAYLKKFDIDYLKIDRSFVKDMESNSGDRAITEAIIGMAHKLGLQVIAEGIETSGQKALLAAAGCDYGQGYLFSKPLPADEFETAFIRGRAMQFEIDSVAAPERATVT